MAVKVEKPTVLVGGSDAIGEAYRTALAKFGDLGVGIGEYRQRLAQVEDAGRSRPGAVTPAYMDLYLALGCQGGDARAWKIFDTSLRGYLRRLCIRATGSEQEGEELLADLFADLVGRSHAPGKITLYRGMAGLATWLTVIVRRMAVDRSRSGERWSRLEPAADSDTLPAEGGSPEESMGDAEVGEVGGRIFRQALAALESQHLLVLRLVYWDELTLREAGRVMSLDFSTVSRRLKAARDALRKALLAISRREHGLTPDAVEELLLQLGRGRDDPATQGG